MRLEERGALLPPGEALSRGFDTDAHAVGYVATRGGRPWPWRLVSEAAGASGLEITMMWLLVDVDAPGHRSIPEWRGAIAARVAGLPGSPFAYFTRGGLRLVWRLREAFPIRSPADAWRWRLAYLAFLDQLEREHGIAADRACCDWTRLHRLPRVVRDGELQEHPTIGDPTRIGVIELPPAPEADAHQSPLCGHEHEPRGRVGKIGCDASGSGLLERLLRDRGDVVGERAMHNSVIALVVRCPNAAAHAPGHGESGDHALLFGGPVGRLLCQRTACSGIDGEAWLRLFTRAELAAAGVRTGRVRRTTVNAYDGGRVRVCVIAEPTDGGGALPYLRISPHTPTWRALWEVADVADPSDLDPRGDLGEALRQLRGREIAIEVGEERVRRILPAGQVAA
jgi:hypothetical protein